MSIVPKPDVIEPELRAPVVAKFDSESISEIDLDVLIKIRTELKSILEDIRKN